MEYLSDEGRAFYEALPTRVTLYRGCEAGRKYGVSWSTDRAVAERFAHGTRFPCLNPSMVKVQVHKEDILAVILDRNESEVLLSPNDLLSGSVKITAVEK